MIDFNALDFATMAGVIGAILKAFRSDAKTEEIKADRKKSREDIDAHFAKIDTRLDSHDQSLKEGNARFDKTDAKLDEMAKTTDAKLDRLNDKQDATSQGISEIKGLIQGLQIKREKWGD